MSTTVVAFDLIIDFKTATLADGAGTGTLGFELRETVAQMSWRLLVCVARRAENSRATVSRRLIAGFLHRSQSFRNQKHTFKLSSEEVSCGGVHASMRQR